MPVTQGTAHNGAEREPRQGTTGWWRSMSGADDANGASVLVAPDWEGAVDGAIRTHERIYRRMEALADERSNLDGMDSPIYPRCDGSRAYPLRLAEDQEPDIGMRLILR